MDLIEVRAYCLSLAGTTEDMPFDDNTIVFRVENKIYALLNLKSERQFLNLKCDPEKAIELRENYSFIVPGYHMNKKHWNTIYIKEAEPESLIKSLINDSRKLIIKALPKELKKRFT